MAEEKKKTGESRNFINLGVAINGQGEVLLIRRVVEEIGRDGAVLRWAFPGGKQRYDESRADCVRREVLAETGYDVNVVKQISLRKHPQFDAVVVYHYCQLTRPEPSASPNEPHEVAEIRWAKPAEILSFFTSDIDPDVKKFLGL